MCILCGGVKPSAQEDHIPSRSCFVNREWPEGYSFGACEQCNQGSRQSDLISSFYVRWMDHEDANLVDADLQRLLVGMRNNHPDLLPRMELSVEEIEKAMSNVAESFVHLSLDPVPAVAVPAAVNPHLARFARKLTCALFFKETSRIVPLDAFLWANWIHYHDKRSSDLFAILDKALPLARTGVRAQRLLTSQFKYVCGTGASGMLFGYLAQFGKSIIVVGAVRDATLTDPRVQHWKTLNDLLAADRLGDTQ